jgi:PadR family transcriptional regulator, regulatory protein PadR
MDVSGVAEKDIYGKLPNCQILYLFISVEYMRRQQYLNTLELMIILALIHLGEDAYGVSIAQEIEHRTGRDVLLGSVYAALDRLEKKGVVSSSLGEATPERGGRAKMYFRVTAKGIREARQTQRALQKLWKRIPQLRGETT